MPGVVGKFGNEWIYFPAPVLKVFLFGLSLCSSPLLASACSFGPVVMMPQSMRGNVLPSSAWEISALVVGGPGDRSAFVPL